jgi:hypothetical protein
MRLDDRLDGFEGFFDELIFVTDELNLKSGKLRADLVALGGKQGVYFPVLIELKAKRNLGEVIQQLDNTIEILSTSPVSFINFLAAATGKSAHSIAFDKFLLLGVLPATVSGKEKANPTAEIKKLGNDFVKDHLLIGHLQWAEHDPNVSPRDRFTSKITFRSQA